MILGAFFRVLDRVAVAGQGILKLFQAFTDVVAEFSLFFQPFLAIGAKLVAEIVTLILACVLHLFAEIFLSLEERVALGFELLNQGLDVIWQSRPIAFGLVEKAANALRDIPVFVFSLPSTIVVRVVRWGYDRGDYDRGYNRRYNRGVYDRYWRRYWWQGRRHVGGRRNRDRSDISRNRRERG